MSHEEHIYKLRSHIDQLPNVDRKTPEYMEMKNALYNSAFQEWQMFPSTVSDYHIPLLISFQHIVELFYFKTLKNEIVSN